MTLDEDDPSAEYPDFPWEAVDASHKDCALQERHGMSEEKEDRIGRSCPKCGACAEALVWIHFRSPPPTGWNLCGTEGVLSFCESCQQCVEYGEEGMS